MADDGDGHRAETKEKDRLQNIHPHRAAHSAEEHIQRHDHRHDGAAHSIRNQRFAVVYGNLGQHRSAAHDADNHVRHQHGRAQGEDDRADVVAFPAIAKKRNLRLVAEFFANRPEARADEKDGQRNDKAGRRSHQAVNANALPVGLP